jgi:Putative beta-barrel porin-2, OmpL-like. bbp2
MAGAVLTVSLAGGAQTPAPATPAPAADQTPAAAPAAPAAPAAAPVWSVGGVDLSGFVDVYYSYNADRPASQINALYNFDDYTNQFNLEAAKITLNHDPDPVGAHLDVIFGRTNTDIHANSSAENADDNYIEQAYISVKPPKAKGFEMDFGQFVTSAGDEVIETMSNWSYSHGLLFTNAIPYYHFGLRTSIPATKAWTFGFQLVNGWNNVVANNGGVTLGVTSAIVKPKYSWFANYYTGPGNVGTEKGYKNLFDTTLMLTPTAKFNAYVNYDYGQNTMYPVKKAVSLHWQGIAASARGQVTGNAAIVGRYEYFYDQGNQLNGGSLLKQHVQEFTGTYEYKWPVGLLMRAEYRYDWSNLNFFPYGNTPSLTKGAKTGQSTATIGLIAFFGPKR